jgi:Putative phage abortive infection protein
MKSNQLKWILIVILLVFLGYLFAVIASGAGWHPFGTGWQFETTGQLGDSFGPLSAVMSSVAAISALLAYWSQREELQRLKLSAGSEQQRLEKNDFENTFFRLITLFRDTLVQIDIDQQTREPARGADALQKFIRDYMISFDDAHTLDKSPENFKKMYRAYQNDLGHYFRLFYHIVRFVDEAPIDDKMKYIRIFRSLLSNTEMVMIGLNCCYGEGNAKLRPLVEKYALLHNISAERAKQFGIVTVMGKAAFGDRKIGADNMLSY